MQRNILLAAALVLFVITIDIYFSASNFILYANATTSSSIPKSPEGTANQTRELGAAEASPINTVEICLNGVDDDGNGLIDETYCIGETSLRAEIFTTVEICLNGVDDGDGQTDEAADCIRIPTAPPSDTQSQRLTSPQGFPGPTTTTIEPAYLKVITTIKNNNATSPYWDQIRARDVLITMRGITPWDNQINDLLYPSSFTGLEKGWNFTIAAGTQYDVYVINVRGLPPNVHHSNDCQGILNAGQSKTCFITVTLDTIPPQISVTPLPSNQTVSPGSANATEGLTNSTR